MSLFYRPFAALVDELVADLAYGPRHARGSAAIAEHEDHVDLQLPLPGYAPEQVALSLSDRQLVIEVTRDDRRARRTFLLPDWVDRDGIESALEHGLLTIRLPRAAAARARSIEVRAGALPQLASGDLTVS